MSKTPQNADGSYSVVVRDALEQFVGLDLPEFNLAGVRRINFRTERFCDDGYWYNVSRWDMEDGSTERYTTALSEEFGVT